MGRCACRHGHGRTDGTAARCASIRYKTNQIIAGTVINILATGLTSYMAARFLRTNPSWNNPGIFRQFPIPILSDIPVIGPLIFENNMFVYAMFLILIALHFGLFNTRWGLRHRAVGEHPKAADTLGINVFRTRYVAVLMGGAMAGFAGSYFTLGSVGRFDEVMTAGRGFISLAAMIFGNWMPFGAFGAGLLFGFADSLASRLAILQVPNPVRILAHGAVHRHHDRAGRCGWPRSCTCRRRRAVREGIAVSLQFTVQFAVSWLPSLRVGASFFCRFALHYVSPQTVFWCQVRPSLRIPAA
jgi:hypothetical protein